MLYTCVRAWERETRKSVVVYLCVCGGGGEVSSSWCFYWLQIILPVGLVYLRCKHLALISGEAHIISLLLLVNQSHAPVLHVQVDGMMSSRKRHLRLWSVWLPSFTCLPCYRWQCRIVLVQSSCGSYLCVESGWLVSRAYAAGAHIGQCPTPRPDTVSSCRFSCKEDNECGGGEKCCPTSCGGTACTMAVPVNTCVTVVGVCECVCVKSNSDAI